jgi:hypothetical protein
MCAIARRIAATPTIETCPAALASRIEVTRQGK